MNSKQLFSRRLRQNWKYQYDIFKTITDWTILLYCIIPSSLVFIIIYSSWWHKAPQWIEHVPFSYLFALFFLFIWGGHFRSYYRDADRIFLIKNKRLQLGLKQKGILYTYIFQLLPTTFLAFIVAPLWLNYYQIGLDKLIFTLGLFLSSKWLVMSIKGRLSMHSERWLKVIRMIPVFLGLSIIWSFYYLLFQNNQILTMVGLIIFNVVASVLLVKDRFTSVKTFEQDLAIDESEKHKYIDLIFSLSLVIDQPSKAVSSRKSPILYSKSNRLFKKRTARNGFLELFIKVISRNSEYFLRYFQIIAVNSIAIILIPSFWIKLIIVLFGLYFVQTWIKDNWDMIVGAHSFTKKYADINAYFEGRKIVTYVFSVVFLLLVSTIYLIKIILSRSL